MTLDNLSHSEQLEISSETRKRALLCYEVPTVKALDKNELRKIEY